jgi:hypothetical protein
MLPHSTKRTCVGARRFGLRVFLPISILLCTFCLRVSGVLNVTLAWDPAPSPDTVGYKLYYGTQSGVYTHTNILGNTTTGTAPGLIENTTYYFVVTAYNAVGLESPPSNELSFTLPNPWLQTWQSLYFSAADLADPTKAATVWGDLADPDHDGRNNLLEYALGLNPLGQTNNNTGITTAILASSGAQFQSLTFNRRKSDASLTYVPQVSSDKQSWSSAAGAVVPTATNSVDSNFDAVTYADLTPVVPGRPRFFQLNVLRYSNAVVVASSTSEVYVATATTIPGNGGSGSQLEYFSLSLVRPVVAGGVVTALGANNLTDANANWSSGQFNGANGPYYVEFASGLAADIVNTDAVNHALVLPGDIRSVVSVGVTYRIRKHMTLAEVFGPHNEAGLLAGNNSAKADDVYLYDTDAQSTQTYFYCNVAGFQGWYRAGDSQPTNNVIIYPEQGIIVERKSASNLTRYLSGVCKPGPSVVPIVPGVNSLGTLKVLKSLRLDQLNLYTGDPLTGLAGGRTAAKADNLVIPGQNGSTTYYYCNVFGFEGWYQAGGNSPVTVAIPPGSVFFIVRNPPNPPFNWIIPAE